MLAPGDMNECKHESGAMRRSQTALDALSG